MLQVPDAPRLLVALTLDILCVHFGAQPLLLQHERHLAVFWCYGQFAINRVHLLPERACLDPVHRGQDTSRPLPGLSTPRAAP